MNPQNRGQHISLRHSFLWRNTLFKEKDIPDVQTCHKQLNEMGQTGKAWSTRNNFIQTNSSGIKNNTSLSIRSRQSVELDSLLKEQRKFSNLKRSMLKSIRPDAASLEKSNQLVEGMKKLRQMDLLTGKDMNHVKFPGIIKVEHVYNDYHLKNANPGFSRNYLGKFYTK